MGLLHLKNAKKIADVEIVAAADSSQMLLNKARDLGVKYLYKDFHDFVNSPLNLDAVVISLPNFLHFESIQLFLEKGLDVFVEKPLARNVAESKQIVHLVKKSGRRLMVGHVMRFFDDIEEMKKIVDKGRIGIPQFMTLERVGSGPFSHGVIPSPVPEWWFDSEKVGGGVVIDLGYHLIDLFMFFNGDCKLLYSRLDHKFNLSIEDAAIILLESVESHTKGMLHIGWYEKSVFPKTDFNVTIHGEAGCTSTHDFEPDNPYLHAAKEGMKNMLRKAVGKEIKPLAYAYNFYAYYKELKHFFNCLQTNSEPSVSSIDGLKVAEIIDECYRSAK
jgi:predicted dehydrogenase